jgi:hypothetical protein
MFLPSGQATEVVDVMQYIWTGQWPEHRSPGLQGFWLNGKTAREDVHLSPGRSYPARVQVNSPGHAPLRYLWEVMKESTAQSVGGDAEAPPPKLPGLVSGVAGPGAQIMAPPKPGAYRLFVYILDTEGRGAYANIPFYVDEKLATLDPPPR